MCGIIGDGAFDKHKFEMHRCRFCSAKERILFAFVLESNYGRVSTFTCEKCRDLIQKCLVTVNVCLYCGNVFYIKKPSGGDIILLPYCGICEKTGQVLKGVDDEKETS